MAWWELFSEPALQRAPCRDWPPPQKHGSPWRHTYVHTHSKWCLGDTGVWPFRPDHSSACTCDIYMVSRKTYTPMFLKRSYCCLFCSLRTCLEARKAVVVSKWCHNFWTKRFQRMAHDKNKKNATKNPMLLHFRRINRQTDTQTHTHTHTEWLPSPSHMCAED